MLVKLPRARRHVMERRTGSRPPTKDASLAGDRFKRSQKGVGEQRPPARHVRVLERVVDVGNDRQPGWLDEIGPSPGTCSENLQRQIRLGVRHLALGPSARLAGRHTNGNLKMS